jgi:hypothetical protein
MNPMEILKQVLPRARNDEELVEMAAQLGPPPPVGFQPPAPPMNPLSAGLPTPQSPLVKGGGKQLVPPMAGMTAGEAKTSPRVGEMLLGNAGGGY